MSWRDPPFKLLRLRDIGFEFWDPYGVIAPGKGWDGHPAADEYDEYLMQAASLTRMGKPVDEVAAYLFDIGGPYPLSGIRMQRKRARETAVAIRAYVEELDGDAARPVDAPQPRAGLLAGRRPYLVSLAVYGAAALVALASLATVKQTSVAFVAFFVIGIGGSWLAGRVFDSLATPEERQRDLEDRVRNPPP